MNKSIIKFLVRSMYFSIFAIILYCIYIIIWGSLFPRIITKNMKYGIGAYGHMYSRLQEANNAENIDILFIGSSHSYRGYDPRVFKKYNLAVLNLGSSSQPPIVSKLLLEKYLLKVNPKLIIIDVFPNVFKIDGIESELDYISNSRPSITTFKLALESKNIKVINTYLYSLFYNYTGLFDSFKEDKVKYYNRFDKKEYDTYITGGYVQTNLQNFDTLSVSYDKKKIEFNSENRQAFKDILVYLKQNNTKYILVQTPITEKQYNSITNNQDLDNYFLKKGSYYNFNTILDLPDKYFYDSNHLNQAGVELFNEKLINILQKDSILTSSIKIE